MPSTEHPFDDDSPIRPEELLLRQVPTGQYDQVKGELLLGALLPMTGDGDGLSLNREVAICAADLLLTSNNATVRELGGILAVAASWLDDEGFPATPDPTDVPGHVLIKGMNRGDYASGGEKKKRIKVAASKLIDRINLQGLIRIRPKPPVAGAG